MHKPRPRIRIFDAVTYFVLVVSSLMAAFLLRFEFAIPESIVPLLKKALILAILIKVPIFYFAGFHRSLRRFAEISDLVRLF